MIEICTTGSNKIKKTNTEIFRTSKLYDKIITNQKDQNESQYSDNFFPTKIKIQLYRTKVSILSL